MDDDIAAILLFRCYVHLSIQNLYIVRNLLKSMLRNYCGDFERVTTLFIDAYELGI
jgi:hypothetical protein